MLIVIYINRESSIQLLTGMLQTAAHGGDATCRVRIYTGYRSPMIYAGVSAGGPADADQYQHPIPYGLQCFERYGQRNAEVD